VAEAGASAVLAGLIVVGVTINLSKIIQVQSLPLRALGPLYASPFALVTVPLLLRGEASSPLIGIELRIGGTVGWSAVP
jgi:hypothetical protein